MKHLFVCAVALAAAAGSCLAQWNPPAGQWGKTVSTDLRVMTWNIQDGICRTNTKTEDFNDWSALARIVAVIKPDILVMQETGDNSGEGTGSGVDTVAQLQTVIGYFLHGGTDIYKGNTAVTAYVQKYAPTYDLPYVYVSSVSDNFNRNVILSRYPFADLNGDGIATNANFVNIADAYAPGGGGGIRGFATAEIDLPNSIYAGNFVMGTAHLKSGGTQSDKDDRLAAGKNIAYFIDYEFNGAGTGVPNPHGAIFDAGVTSILTSNTPVVWAGDMNEDENSNGRDGPVWWMVNAATAGGTDGTDRDRTDSTYDDARDPFNNSRATQSSSKLDYVMYQDSIAQLRRAFIFNSTTIGGGNTYPPELIGFTGGPSLPSSLAADHKPVIVDFILPLVPPAPGPFSLTSPAEASVGNTLTPTLTWSASSNATSYTVKVALDAGLTTLVSFASTSSTTWVVPSSLLQTCQTYYWGVTATNTTGSTASTPASWSFDTYRPADFDGSGFVDFDDYIKFVEDFEAGLDSADFDGTGFVDFDDFIAYVLAFESGC